MLCSAHPIWLAKNVLSAKLWFVKTLTRIVKYESQVIREYLAYGSYGGATLKLAHFEDLDTASKDYKNSKSVPGRV